MELTSPAFANNTPLPDQYTCKGAGFNPPLNISGVPEAAQSLVLIVHDPDAPGGDFTHWTVWNISATTTIIKEHSVPDAAVQGITDYKKIGYGPPCPPSGTHRYLFVLYALNRQLSLPAGAPLPTLNNALEDHVIAKTELIGLVSA